MRSLTTAATGMQAQQLNVEVISNNLANMNTTGFKRQRAEFQDLLYQNIQQMGVDSSDAGTIVPTGVQVGLGVETSSIYRITDQGALENTGNRLDMAISGAGYFRIQMPDGSDAYTRAGNFAVSPDGQIVTMDGYTVAPGIAVPQGARDIAINQQGQVQVLVDGATAPQTIGQMEVVTFFNEAGLDAMGDNLYRESAASGTATAGTPGSPGYGVIRQGFLESSNVNSVSEITALISAQRAYEMNARVISAADEMMQASANLR
ncbi:flagellar basal-body rod protein FlgG [Maricaulis sp. D1M11]|uniref:flagellar basal-body rod protein FlgG n=1 Tax=Maricaulis sp. D1M11 TaxID=3076117 RepID=UPI0039B41A51